jgi:lipopolysaccharide/colanic/teichoic acid biosynthesis glycosyltransferase
MERAYIETWSLGADLRILLHTVGVVASGRGAY